MLFQKVMRSIYKSNKHPHPPPPSPTPMQYLQTIQGQTGIGRLDSQHHPWRCLGRQMNMGLFPNKLTPNVISPPNVKPLYYSNFPWLCSATDYHWLACSLYIYRLNVSGGGVLLENPKPNFHVGQTLEDIFKENPEILWKVGNIHLRTGKWKEWPLAALSQS